MLARDVRGRRAGARARDSRMRTSARYHGAKSTSAACRRVGLGEVALALRRCGRGERAPGPRRQTPARSSDSPRADSGRPGPAPVRSAAPPLPSPRTRSRAPPARQGRVRARSAPRRPHGARPPRARLAASSRSPSRCRATPPSRQHSDRDDAAAGCSMAARAASSRIRAGPSPAIAARTSATPAATALPLTPPSVMAAAAETQYSARCAVAAHQLAARRRQCELRVPRRSGPGVNRPSLRSTGIADPCAAASASPLQTSSPARAHVARQERVVDRAVDVARLAVPSARAPVQHRLQSPVRSGGARARSASATRAVMAEARVRAVERHDEAGAAEPRERVGGAGSLKQRVAERARQRCRPPTCSRMKSSNSAREVAEHLVAHVVERPAGRRRRNARRHRRRPLAEEQRPRGIRPPASPRCAGGGPRSRSRPSSWPAACRKRGEPRSASSPGRAVRARRRVAAARMRASGSAGSCRPANASVAARGRSFAIARERGERRLAAQRVDVVEHEHERRVAVVADGVVDRARDGGEEPRARRCRARRARPTRTGAGRARSHSRSSVVLP